MNQNRPKCHSVWWKQFFNWCQLFAVSISWMGPSGARVQGNLKDLSLCFGADIYWSLQVLFQAILLFPLHTEALKARSQPLLMTVSQTIKSSPSFVSCLWGGGSVLEDSSQKCPKVQNMHSSWLCISVPSPDAAALWDLRFVPTTSEIKRGVCSGWTVPLEMSAHSSGHCGLKLETQECCWQRGWKRQFLQLD